MNLRKNKCIICYADLKKSHLPGLSKCKSCGFITTNADLSESELEKLYSADYFHGTEYADYVADKQVIQANFRDRLNILLGFISNPEKKELFEIGCAYGFFLELAQKHFFEVSGIDISAEPVEFARKNFGINAVSGDFLNMEPNKKFDIFCLWDTIEHLKQPHLFIRKAAQYINKNGLIAITTGDIDSINARIRKEKWRIIHPPTHIHYFSKKTLSNLLEKNGFKLVHVSYPGARMSLNHIFYIILVLRLKKPTLYKMLENTGILRAQIHVNMRDIVYLIARKT